MRNLFYRVSSAAARFMYGRNGGDQLNLALLALYLLVWLAQALLGRIFTARVILDGISLAVPELFPESGQAAGRERPVSALVVSAEKSFHRPSPETAGQGAQILRLQKLQNRVPCPGGEGQN